MDNPISSDSLLIIDDHSIFRAGLRLTLSEGIQPSPTIKEAGTIAEALDVLRGGFEPDLILTDLLMPGISGFDGIKMLKQACSKSKVILMTALADRQIEHESMLRQADGFINKTALPSELTNMVRNLIQTGQPADGHEKQVHSFKPMRLTSRQIEVLNLLAHGDSNKVVARKLNLSENTIRVHVSAILEQLDCDSRYEAVERARSEGLLRK